MKKCIFLSFSLGNTSVADYFLELAKKFNEQNQVIIFSDKRKPENLIIPDEIEIKYWPSIRPVKFKDAYFLYNNMRKHKPIMSISNFGSVNIFLLTGFFCGIKNRIVWIHSISSAFLQKKFTIIRKSFVYKLATKVIANSNATKEDAINVFNVKDSKIIVLPNSVKKYNHLLTNSLVDKSKIVYVGRLHYSKGIDVLIKAVAELVNQNFNIHLDIIGDGPEKDALTELTFKLNLSDKVLFLGGKTKTEVLNAFKSSFCAVIPSRAEAFGFTVTEAMSVATCVIGADNTGIKEIIIHNQTGLLFETGNYYDLALKIKSILINEKLRNNLATNGFERFLNNYETNYAINRDFEYFSTILKEN